MMKKIAIGNLKISLDEKKTILDVCNSRISEDKYTRLFEQEFANKIKSKYCITTSSGTAALIAALTALIESEKYPKVKRGAKVITTPTTYVATSNAIINCGLEPVFVDVNLNTFDINVNKVEELLENSNPDEYCMILPVHIMGFCADMEKINELAIKYDLVVFEDAAQAHGSKLNGKYAGTMSTIADFSFYIAHNIQVGEMGCVVTDDEDLARMVKQIKCNGRRCTCSVCVRNQGKCPYKDDIFDPRFLHDYIGYNFKTTEFATAIGVSQLKKFDDIIKKRYENVKYLNDHLYRVEYALTLPKLSTDVSYLAYPIITNPFLFERKHILNELTKRGIESRAFFPCIPTQQPSYKNYFEKYKGKVNTAEYLGENAFYLPCHQYLTQSEIDYIVDVLLDIIY